METQVLDLYDKGLDAFQANRYEEARRFFNALIAYGKRFPDVLNMLGVIAYEAGQMKAAETQFREALEMNPAYTEAGLNLAVALNDQGRAKEAEEVIAAVRRISGVESGEVDPYVKGKLANLHAELGEVYRRVGLFDDAIREYKTALSLRADFPDLRMRLGVLLRDMGLVDDAVDELRGVVAAFPAYAAAWVELGVTLYGFGKKDEAAEIWRRVLDADPKNHAATRYLRLAKKSYV